MGDNSAINLDNYKLSYELRGHSMDVRALNEGNQFLISGSRDKTTKIWKKDNDRFVEDVTLKDHSNFVSAVCYLKSEGWICTGSNDSTICVYKQSSYVPFAILKGHTETVCALSNCFLPNTILSGSWDTTARVWTVNDLGDFTFFELKGHEAAVWAVASFRNGTYVTGGADKAIIFWNANGKQVQMIKEHKDCVRGLIGLDDGSLISCSNDATICLWNDKGERLQELYGHTNYIYSISLNSFLGNDIIVSGSEDSTIRMWSLKTGALGQSISLPAQSVWSVICLENGDIVTGTSDGIIRIFTKDQSRFASTDTMEAFEVAVNLRKVEASKELGGIKRTDLPGPESLLQPGQDGQTKLVRHPDGKVLCYEWSNNKWSVVGDVVGASGGNSVSEKTYFEGKEYDYVFNVDISDNAPPIKLPYNRDEDPFFAAQSFIHKNNLPQAHLDQVANFIIKNTAWLPKQLSNSGYDDPFTGGSRYIPDGTSPQLNTVGNVDPFTGASSYAIGSTQIPADNKPNNTKPFPFYTYLTFDHCDPLKILEKLRVFNTSLGNSNLYVSDDILNAVVGLISHDVEVDKLSIQALQHLMMWPEEILFPVLDIARLCVRNESVCALLANEELLLIVIENLTTTSANQLMSARFLANMIRHSTGQKLIISRLKDIMHRITAIKNGNTNLQIAIATLFLNITILQLKYLNAEMTHFTAERIIEFFLWITDLEAFYRTMQAIGNLISISHGSITTQIVSVDYLIDKIQTMSITQYPSGLEKISVCAKALIDCFYI